MCEQIWNVQNGHNLHNLESVQEAEVTGVTPLTDKKLTLAVGWSRMITKYDDSDQDVSSSSFAILFYVEVSLS